MRAAKKASKREGLEEWLHEETKRLEAVCCVDCPDEYACNECGDESIDDIAKADYHRRVVLYYISRKLRRFGVGVDIAFPNEWKVSPDKLWKRLQTDDEDEYEENAEEWYKLYDAIVDDYGITSMPIELYELFGAKVFTVDFTVPEISDYLDDGALPSEKEILNAFKLGTKGMPRSEKMELLKSYVCEAKDVRSFGFQKIYVIRFPHVARDLSFSWGLGHDIVRRLWKIASYPIMITNYHEVATLAGTDYVITSSSIPNEYETYRYMEYGENMFNYTGMAALYLLEIAHFYLEEQRKKWF